METKLLPPPQARIAGDAQGVEKRYWAGLQSLQDRADLVCTVLEARIQRARDFPDYDLVLQVALGQERAECNLGAPGCVARHPADAPVDAPVVTLDFLQRDAVATLNVALHVTGGLDVQVGPYHADLQPSTLVVWSRQVADESSAFEMDERDADALFRRVLDRAALLWLLGLVPPDIYGTPADETVRLPTLADGRVTHKED